MVDIYNPKSLKEALDILSFTDCIIFAGGTDLMVRKKQWSGLVPNFEKPVMFISGLEKLGIVVKEKEHLVIGAACTLAELIDNELVPEIFKSVMRQMASPGIRNIATLGGNICNASPAGDCLPLLYALDASLEIQSSCRKVNIPIGDFIIGPGKTALRSGELVTSIRIPEKSFDIAVYKKVGTRKSTALSKVSFVGMASMNDGELEDVRIAFGAVAPTVVRSKDIEEEIIDMIKSGSIDHKEIISDYNTFIKPISDQRSTAFYRRETCKRLLIDFVFSSLLKEELQ